MIARLLKKGGAAATLQEDPAGFAEIGGGERDTIRLRGVTKVLGAGRKQTLVFDRADAEFPRGVSIGVLGGASSGKTTLVNLLNGNQSPTEGRIDCGMSVSWPLASRTIFTKRFSIRQNVRFVSAIYNAWPPDMLDAVTDLGKIKRQDLDTALDLLPDELNTRATISLCLALSFDCYVVDERVALGNKPFRDLVQEKLLEMRGDRSLIVVTRTAQTIREMCDECYVIIDRKLQKFGSKGEAILAFRGATGGQDLSDPLGE
ncbi:ATP-binding cassette domain-containing protein [Methylopila sp. Yamaguchi]|uniref:ATP-binding cassette domain-containing protein n=1 Tax=Methylopila sp. Yamaguchi TaxID=1437817 RepID=UPI000CB2E91B|nr:ATP-binding cassette domain-containing protein [Methylopila sp. Yamaguchi]GBD47396.1 ABC transporter ATPase [Methylopila sp. Yamaguchi]